MRSTKVSLQNKMFSPDYQLIRKEQQAWKKIELDDI
jgi:hypothetical protein